MNDLLLMFLFFGNDFIPHLSTIRIDEFNIDILFFTYIYIVNKYNFDLVNNIEKDEIKCFKIII